MAIKKEQKIIFANAFIITKNGMEALEAAGVPATLENLQKVLSDSKVYKLLEAAEKQVDLIKIWRGETKEAHVYKLQKAFNQALGIEKMEITKMTKVGFQSTTAKDTDLSAVVKLSERIEALENWGAGDGGEITVDLKLGDEFENREAVELESKEEREKKVEDLLKIDGVV